MVTSKTPAARKLSRPYAKSMDPLSVDVAQATGEDVELIEARGFSLLSPATLSYAPPWWLPLPGSPGAQTAPAA